MSKHWSQFLTHYYQDGSILDEDEAIGECAQYDSFHQFWTQSKQADYMLEIAGIWSKREPLVLAACTCARLALPHIPAEDKRPLIAIETAEAWARGEVDIEQVETAANANIPIVTAYNASSAVYYAVYAAYSAACSAHNSVFNAADSVYYAASAAAHTISTYDVSSYDQTLEECANIVRQMLPEPPFQRYYDLKAFI